MIGLVILLLFSFLPWMPLSLLIVSDTDIFLSVRASWIGWPACGAPSEDLQCYSLSQLSTTLTAFHFPPQATVPQQIVMDFGVTTVDNH